MQGLVGVGWQPPYSSSLLLSAAAAAASSLVHVSEEDLLHLVYRRKQERVDRREVNCREQIFRLSLVHKCRIRRERTLPAVSLYFYPPDGTNWMRHRHFLRRVLPYQLSSA